MISIVYITGQLRILALGFAAILLRAPGGNSAQIEGARLYGQLDYGDVLLLLRRVGILRYRIASKISVVTCARVLRDNG